MEKFKDIVSLISEFLNFPRNYNHNSTEVEWNCPHCDNGRNKFNLAVNIENNVFHCWACGYKGKILRLFYDYANKSVENFIARVYRSVQSIKGLHSNPHNSFFHAIAEAFT